MGGKGGYTVSTSNFMYLIGQFLPIASDLLEHCVEKDSKVSTGLTAR